MKLIKFEMERLLKQKSILIVPGDHFGMDNYLRIGYGPPPEYLHEALEFTSDVLRNWMHSSGWGLER